MNAKSPLTSSLTSVTVAAVLAAAAAPGALRADKTSGPADDTLASAAKSGAIAPSQSKADPLGLKIVGPTRIGGSDAASKDFQNNVLPSALQFIKQTLPECRNNTAAVNALPLDPAKLTLATTENVRAYVVYEGAGYVNSLGVNTTGSGVWQGNPELIFPAVRSSDSAFASAPAGTRTTQDPLLPGDFVNLGVMQAGTKLDFFLMANGANGGTTAWNTSGSNPDGLNHVASFAAQMFAVPQLNSPYLFIAFEDLLGGGDKDYNDTIFALDVGAATVNSLVTTPEPSLGLVLTACLPLGLFLHRRNKAKASKAATIA